MGSSIRLKKEKRKNETVPSITKWSLQFASSMLQWTKEFHQDRGLLSFHLAMGKRKMKLFLVLQNGVLNLPHHASVTKEKQFLVLQNGFLNLPRACFNEPKSFIRILNRHPLLSSGNGKRTRMKHFDEPKRFIRIVIHVPFTSGNGRRRMKQFLVLQSGVSLKLSQACFDESKIWSEFVDWYPFLLSSGNGKRGMKPVPSIAGWSHVEFPSSMLRWMESFLRIVDWCPFLPSGNGKKKNEIVPSITKWNLEFASTMLLWWKNTSITICGFISLFLSSGNGKRRRMKLFLELQNGVLNLPRPCFGEPKRNCSYYYRTKSWICLKHASINQPKSFIKTVNWCPIPLSSGNGKKKERKKQFLVLQNGVYWICLKHDSIHRRVPSEIVKDWVERMYNTW